MSNLTTFSLDVNTLPAPTGRKPVAPELISGDPSFRSWIQDESFDGKVRSGIWEATPGLTQCLKPHTYEYCYIIEGAVEISEEGGETTIYRTGDSFGLKPGFVGTWRTLETLKKFYVAVTL
ncbi:cupin domain-containing protein [Mesorhizobium sp. B2-5-13]|uniref:cupin domain-containing protein n=1 Tax=unclassified Mesorhizobium TaxID=325217 RepID=UPI001126E394|nr:MULTISPECIES: cupin domain-containing protein [unclassified Mesorhizobium]TPJ81919.1 cupin domain-containing protein [Mesorhizobium sp. B2-5-13]TPK45856.1 cupin domain-containing protein [Mesorhizobium sp. B2-5-5]